MSMHIEYTKEKYMSYATWHNSFISQYLLNIYVYCRLCTINCENKIIYMFVYIFLYVLSRVRGLLTNNNEFWIGRLILLTPSFAISIN
jgi:hypothetical protein